jgi:hypothetical protein
VNQPEHNAFFIDDNASFSACLPNPLLDLAKPLGNKTGRNLAIGGLTDRLKPLKLAFDRQTEGEPILFSGDIIENRLKSKALEPPRGSRAQVSLEIVAVHDDWPALVEFRRCFSTELPERDVDRGGKMRLFVLIRSEDFHELCAIVY